MADTETSGSLSRLLGALESTNPDDRRLAAETLGALRQVAAPALDVMTERSITDPDPSVRYALLWALEQVPWHDVDATPIFIRLLEHENEVTAAYAAWAIGKVGPEAPGGVAELARIAADKKRLVDPRWSAVVALERFGQSAEDATSTLLPILDDERADMREATARALGVISEGHTQQHVVDAIAERLKDEHQHVRESAAIGLKYAGRPLATGQVESLEALAEDQWPLVREAGNSALMALTGAGRHAGMPAPPPSKEHLDEVAKQLKDIEKRLSSDNDRERGGGVYRVGTLGPEGVDLISRLIPMYGLDKNLDVRWSAAWAFGRMGPSGIETVPAMLRGLKLDPNPDVRAITAWALGQLAPHAGEWASLMKDYLVGALRDHDSLVREEAVSALGEFGAGASGALHEVEALTQDPHLLVRRRASQATTRISTAAAASTT